MNSEYLSQIFWMFKKKSVVLVCIKIQKSNTPLSLSSVDYAITVFVGQFFSTFKQNQKIRLRRSASAKRPVLLLLLKSRSISINESAKVRVCHISKTSKRQITWTKIQQAENFDFEFSSFWLWTLTFDQVWITLMGKGSLIYNGNYKLELKLKLP